jgi:hypothetical protein
MEVNRVAIIVDDDVQRLKKKMATLKLRLERLKAADDCENLMDKYQYYNMKNMRNEETQLFALKSPGACVEMMWGIYDEPEGVMRWRRSQGYGKPREKGVFPLHCMCTPIIEVAKDGETAKGLWIMLGAENRKRPDGTVNCMWSAGRFAMDFIKEDGEWKIWKYNTTGILLAPFEKGWHKANGTRAQIEENVEKAMADTGDLRPDRRPSYTFMANKGEWQENIPPVPVPYETWDDALPCIPPPGKKWELTHR